MPRTHNWEASEGKGDQAMSIRILLVDDDLQVLRMVVEALEWKGYSITTASSGETAVETKRGIPGPLPSRVC